MASEISDDQYREIVKFVTGEITKARSIEGGGPQGVRWQARLRPWIIDQVAEKERLKDEEYLKKQKEIATFILRRMQKVFGTLVVHKPD